MQNLGKGIWLHGHLWILMFKNNFDIFSLWRRSRNLFSFTNSNLANTDTHNIAIFPLLCCASSTGEQNKLHYIFTLKLNMLNFKICPNFLCLVFDLHKKSRGFLWQRKSEVIVATQLPEAHTTHLVLNPSLSL